MRIDFRAGESQFVDHLAPIYLALPPEHRGAFVCQRGLGMQAQRWGVTASHETENPARPVVVASYGDHKRVRREGRKIIARVEHGAGQSYFGDLRFGGNASYAGGRDNDDASLFLCPNEDSADRWRDAYPRAQVEIIGCPKLDYLPAREPGPLTAAISFHFDINIIPETRWAWPAYKPYIPALARRFNLIAHAHPKAVAAGIGRRFQRMDVPFVEDFAEVCRQADVYAVDNSSTLFEFASTGRPVVVLNDPAFRRDVSHGGRFWDAAHVGLQVDDPAHLTDVVAEALTTDTTAQREDALSIVYAYRSGAAQRAADALLSWAGVSREVAA